jgi:hypothetical protein
MLVAATTCEPCLQRGQHGGGKTKAIVCVHDQGVPQHNVNISSLNYHSHLHYITHTVPIDSTLFHSTQHTYAYARCHTTLCLQLHTPRLLHLLYARRARRTSYMHAAPTAPPIRLPATIPTTHTVPPYTYYTHASPIHIPHSNFRVPHITDGTCLRAHQFLLVSVLGILPVRFCSCAGNSLVSGLLHRQEHGSMAILCLDTGMGLSGGSR